MGERLTGRDSAKDVGAFIARWTGREGGAERANYQMFLTELCALIGVAKPDPAGATTELNDYVFERQVKFKLPDGQTLGGRIDLYKRGSFVLEAKQSRLKGGRKELKGADPNLFGSKLADKRGRADRGWDVLMLNARRQAEDYAKALPPEHGWPPFLLVCDVGRSIEVFADFTGQGKNYAQFPDRNGFRIFLEDLQDAAVRERLVQIWNEPYSLDPTRKAAKVTREIAERLAEVSKSLERRKYGAEEVALFLMRCLFTMFAEDVTVCPRRDRAARVAVILASTLRAPRNCLAIDLASAEPSAARRAAKTAPVCSRGSAGNAGFVSASSPSTRSASICLVSARAIQTRPF